MLVGSGVKSKRAHNLKVAGSHPARRSPGLDSLGGQLYDLAGNLAVFVGQRVHDDDYD